MNESNFSMKQAQLDFSNKIKNQQMDYIIDNDPSNTGKYVYWICKNVVEGVNYVHAVDLAKWFHSNSSKLDNNKRDIKNYAARHEICIRGRRLNNPCQIRSPLKNRLSISNSSDPLNLNTHT